MDQTFGRADHIRADGGWRQRRFHAAEHEIAAHAGGQVDDDVDIATGRITGREALWQIAMMPIGLGIGFTVIALIAVAVR